MSASGPPARILCVVGARPNFMKIAPIMRAFADPQYGLEATLVHTGQHYDAAMKLALFEQLKIPEPDIDLGVGSEMCIRDRMQTSRRPPTNRR